MTVTSATAGLTGTTIAPTSTSGTSTTGSTTQTGSAEAQDRFLKLLVAQLSNQDPMNPMDNAQMTSQMAQINTVSGIQQLNDTMKNMTTQMSAMQVLQAGNLVGHNVLAAGNQLAFDNATHTAVGGLELGTAATEVKIQVTTTGGQVVDTVSLGKLPAGQHGFTVDTTNYPADTELKFTVVATNGTDAVIATPLMRDRVVAVGSDSNGLNLTLLNNGSTPYSGVRSVL